uniref:hypothetical protein n=1 Tax=Roseivirga sp. TaxID=1964215 RepID=UPI0040470A13
MSIAANQLPSKALEEIDIEKYSEWPIYNALRNDINADKLIRKTLKELERTKAKAIAAKKSPSNKTRPSKTMAIQTKSN